MGVSETWLRDARGLEAILASMAEAIERGRRRDLPLRLVGIRKRGVPIARRLAALLAGPEAAEVPVGAVDITLYRDDLGQRASWPVLRGTEIPFSVEDAEIILVDDVMQTGRTARAALNAVCDLGRPGVVRLAAVVDRGDRELPLFAAVVGMNVTAGPSQRISVRIAPIDEAEGIVQEEVGGARFDLGGGRLP
jgi:pyrimidine operon attenuation protein/uracil phosphoribosyltransferase